MNLDLRARLHAFLRYTERYTKTDMVYLAQSGFWINLGTLAVSGFSLLLYIIFARTLSPETYGIYQYLLSAGALIGSLTLTGMNSAVIRAVALGREGMLRKSIRTQLVWGVFPFAVAVAIGIYYFFNGNLVLGSGFVLMGIFVPFNNALNTYGALLLGKKDFRRGFYYNLSTNALFYTALGLTAFVAPSAIFLIGANLITQAVGLIAAYRATLRAHKPNDEVDDETIKYGKHLSFMGVLGAVALQIDNLLVFQFLGPAAVAVYGFATAIPDRLGGLFKFIPTSLFPILSAGNNVEAKRAVAWDRLLWVFVSVGVLGGIYALCAPLLFSILFPAYSASVPYSQVYALSMIGMIGYIFSTALMAQKQIRSLYIFNTVLPIGQMLLLVAGIAFYGLWGLIIAKIVSSWVFVALAAYLVSSSKEL